MINKQEVIEKVKRQEGLTVKDKDFNFEIEMIPKGDVLEIIEQIDEPERPVVPQFVADFYESIKDDFEGGVYELCAQFYEDESELSDGLYWWFKFSANKPIQTLVNMHQFGYKVVKEKLYTLKIPVGAVQVTPDNHGEVKAFAYPQEITFGYELIMHSIETLEGNMLFSDGDYLIKNQSGECYVCRKDVFEKTYREVEE